MDDPRHESWPGAPLPVWFVLYSGARRKDGAPGQLGIRLTARDRLEAIAKTQAQANHELAGARLVSAALDTPNDAA